MVATGKRSSGRRMVGGRYRIRSRPPNRTPQPICCTLQAPRMPFWVPPSVVPALTSNRSINLNKRISLLSTAEPIACSRRTLPCPVQHGEVAGRGHTPPVLARRLRYLHRCPMRPAAKHELSGLASHDDHEQSSSVVEFKACRAEFWHLWTVIIPRRSITGRLVRGRVWRRHDGRRWQYKKFVEYGQDDAGS